MSSWGWTFAWTNAYHAAEIYTKIPEEARTMRKVTDIIVNLAPQNSIPVLISTTCNIETMRNKHPITEEMAVINIPVLRVVPLTTTLKPCAKSSLLRRLRQSFMACATSDEKRKKLNESTSKITSCFAVRIPGWQRWLLLRLFWPGDARDSPTKMAMVKSEFTFMTPSRAVTATLVLPLLPECPEGAMAVL